MKQTFLLDGSKLTPDDVVRISRDFDQQIDLTEETWNKIKKARHIV
jgi:histidine ammonia-lyase